MVELDVTGAEERSESQREEEEKGGKRGNSALLSACSCLPEAFQRGGGCADSSIDISTSTSTSISYT